MSRYCRKYLYIYYTYVRVYVMCAGRDDTIQNAWWRREARKLRHATLDGLQQQLLVERLVTLLSNVLVDGCTICMYVYTHGSSKQWCDEKKNSKYPNWNVNGLFIEKRGCCSSLYIGISYECVSVYDGFGFGISRVCTRLRFFTRIFSKENFYLWYCLKPECQDSSKIYGGLRRVNEKPL